MADVIRATIALRQGLQEHIRLWAESSEGKKAMQETSDKIKAAIKQMEAEQRLDPELMRKPVEL